MDIDSWLRKLGLGQYEAAFRDNAIDEKVLPRLTAGDLKDLGVGLVGHRRKLLDAIAALRGDENAEQPPSEALPHAPASAQASAPPATVAPPSRPGEFHPEPLTDPDVTLSCHPARATARRLPPSVENLSSSRYRLALSQRR